MYCGPIRHRMDEKVDPGNDFSRKLIVHQTSLEVSDDLTHIQDLFRALVHDEAERWQSATTWSRQLKMAVTVSY